MKSLTKVFVVALVVTAVSAFVPSSAFAQQNTDTELANASANIIAPITLTLDTDLVFGDIVPNTTAGTVTMDNGGTITGVSGGVVALASTRNAATFTVAGQAGRLYTVTPVANITISNVAGTDMIINPTSDCGGGLCTIGAVGGSAVRVGGTLNVGAAQAAALYTGTFSVTVTYN